MIIDRIGKLNCVQNFIKKTSDKKFYNKINSNLPQIESVFAGICYIGAIQSSKTIPEERKPSQHFQTIIGTGAGMLISKKLDNWAKKHQEQICKELELLNIPKSKNVLQGIRVLIPMLITTAILRFGVSVLSVPISSKIAQLTKDKKKNDSGKILDEVR